MKKAILIVAVVGAFGWAVYEFVSSSNDDTAVEDTNESSANENKVTSEPAESNNEEVEKSDEVGIEEGQIAPDFELETVDGETTSLEDHRGTPVIVNFWATWCPPCRAEIPDLRELYEEKDVEILAVNLTDTESDRDDIEPFVDDFEMEFPVLLDESSKVAETYNIVAYPTSYMIDSEGHIQFIAMGAMNYEMMEKELEKMD